MKQTSLACYALLASAFILAGLLVFSISDQLESEAEARMVISEPAFTLMTSQTRENEEALWVLDNRAAIILIYRMELRGADKGRLELAAAVNLRGDNLFGGGGAAAGGGGARGR